MEAQRYNAAADLIGRNLDAGRGSKVAVIDEAGSYTYSEVAERVDRCANALRGFGIEPEQRILLCLLDGIDFPTCFLGAIKAGIIPVPLNTLMQPPDSAHVLSDSGAKAVICSEPLVPGILEAARLCDWSGKIIVSGGLNHDLPNLSTLMAAASGAAPTAPTKSDDACFWLYSSGSTGKPKAAVHLQRSPALTAELFARPVLGLRDSDIIYSASKLFFGYGLGNAITFPFAVGATAILFSGRANAPAVCKILRERKPTILFGVPTIFASLLASQDLPGGPEMDLRLCVSSGEALPETIGRNWTARTGLEIVDGLGTTELLHVFICTRPGSCRYGTIGKTVPGYKVRLLTEGGDEVSPGDVGNLHVSGPTAAVYYWGNREKTRNTFLGEWVKTGDSLRQSPEGDYIYCGRSDEMLKVSGLWVSPIELESALMAHESVLEAAVTGAMDENGLVKPKAYVVLKPGVPRDPELISALAKFVASRLARYQCPRWIEFVDQLPKTATGKIRRKALPDATTGA